MAKKVEIAYRKPGQTWKRKVVTEAALERTLTKLTEDGAEVLVRDAD